MDKVQDTNNKPDWNALFQNAIQLTNIGKFAEAVVLFESILLEFPDNAGLLVHYGSALLRMGNQEASLQAYAKALVIDDTQVNVYANQAVAYRELHRYAEALNSCARAIELKPDYVLAYVNQGDTLQAMHNFAGALQSYDKAIKLQANNGQAWLGRAIALQALKQYEQANHCYQQMLNLFPAYPFVYSNQGNLFQDLKQFKEAVASYNSALALNPNDAFCYASRANAYLELKQFALALADYDKAISINPRFVEAYTNKAQLLLLIGEFHSGWELYEWRFKNNNVKTLYRNLESAIYQGQNLSHKTIFIQAEQGLGDAIQYCRYVKLLADQGAQVILETLSPLLTLFKTLDSRLQIVEVTDTVPKYDFQISLLSLPRIFNTQVDTIPAWSSYLSVDEKKTKLWQARLGNKQSLRVGLVWSGSAEHKNDHNRSLSLSQLTPILALPFEFHCLQKEIRDVDAVFLGEQKNIQVHHLQFHDFSDTAVLIDQMDVIISVDTAVAHLAGALGKPTCLMLTYIPDYRWLLERNDSPWYPSIRLFRQDEARDWSYVVDEIKLYLQTLIN